MAYYIEWKPEYEVGNLMVDREHHQLIKLFNLLLAADNNEKEKGGLGVRESFEALSHYMNTHFKNEEKLLETVNSPYLSSQQTHHKMLSQELNNLWSSGSENPMKNSMPDLIQWCEFRLLNHFLVNDATALHSFPFENNSE